MKHTPGPWTYADGKIFMCLKDEQQRDAVEFKFKAGVPLPLWEMNVGAYSSWVQFPPKGWEEMQQANGTLIAAAPDLLRMIEVLFCDPSGEPSFAGSTGDKEYFKETLAKARGEK